MPSSASWSRVTTPHCRRASSAKPGLGDFRFHLATESAQPEKLAPFTAAVSAGGAPRWRRAPAVRLARAPMSELLFKPATELATLIHTGQISSAELVGAALERIEALQPTINAFTHIDADGALAAAEAVGARRPAAVRGRPDRGEGHGAGRRDALHDGVGHLRGLRARSRRLPRAPPARRRVRDRRQDEHAGVRHPAGVGAAALRAGQRTHGTRTGRRAGPRAAPPPRWRRGCCRSPTAAMAAARSGSRRRAAGSWA